MIVCPYCDYENIEGSDECESCSHSLTDLHLSAPISAVEEGLLKHRVRHLLPRAPLTVGPTTKTREVLRLMVDHSVGCVVVVSEDEKPLGVFTERDALLKLNTRATELGDRPVSEFMTPNPQTLALTAKIAFAVQRMDQGGFRHVPLVDDTGCVTGVISVRDILRYFTEKMDEE